MKKNNLIFNLTLCVFIIIEILLGVIIQLSDDLPYKILTVLSITVAVLGATIFFRKNVRYYYMLTALVFTLFADFLLSELITFNGLKTVSMIFFSITQLCYFARLYLYQKNQNAKKLHLIARATLIIIAIIVTIGVLKEKTNTLALISLFYFANLVINVIVAFTQFKQAPLFAVGLLLFSCCDIVIGLLQLDNFLPLPTDSFVYVLDKSPINLAWFFYVPSQTCIVCDIALQSRKK